MHPGSGNSSHTEGWLWTLQGGGYTCPAAKFLTHLTPRTPDRSHLISPLLLFCSLFAFMYLTHPTLHSPAIKPIQRELLESLLYATNSMQCLNEVCRSSWSYRKPSFVQMKDLARNFFPPFTGGNGPSTSAFHMNHTLAELLWLILLASNALMICTCSSAIDKEGRVSRFHRYVL